MKAPTVEEIRNTMYGPSLVGLSYSSYTSDWCAEKIVCSYGMGVRQCQKKPGYGPHGVFCKQHAKQYEGCE